MSIVIIINPVAGARGPDAAVGARVDLARRVAAESGEAADVFVTTGRGHARALARDARAGGARLVIAWGGDGTVNEVASALAFGDVPFAVVPAGSGNGLARELGVPADPAAALRAALRAAPRAIDAGELGGRLFVNIAGLGFDAHIAARFNDPQNGRRGLLGYALLTVRELGRYVACRYEISTPDAHLAVRALLVVIANGTEFGNRMRIAPGARVDDGALDLVVVEDRPGLARLWNLRRLITGSVERAPIWSSRRIERVTIESDAPILFHVDGEPIQGGVRLEGRVHPGALRMCVS